MKRKIWPKGAGRLGDRDAAGQRGRSLLTGSASSDGHACSVLAVSKVDVPALLSPTVHRKMPLHAGDPREQRARDRDPKPEERLLWRVSLTEHGYQGAGSREARAQGLQLPLPPATTAPSRYWVRLGEHSLSRLDWTEQIRRSGLSVTHPDYRGSQRSHEHDLRLLRLRTPARLTLSVQPLPLPSTCATAGTNCQISGWGTTNRPWGKGPGCGEWQGL